MSLDRHKVIRPQVLADRIATIRSTWFNAQDRRPRIVQCSGCFDLLHPGHVRHLETAQSWGDLLIVSLNDDESIRALKGAGRPILDLQERIILLTALSAVDYVTWFTEATPDHVISLIKPDVYVKGDEYALDQIPELSTVFQHGAFRPMPHTGWTTTALIERIVDASISSASARIVSAGTIRTETISTRPIQPCIVHLEEGAEL